MRIDAHQHFWQYHAGMDWITDEMASIRRNFRPEDLQPVLQQHAMDGCVAVQADESDAETDYLLQFAARHPFIRGVVGWVDICAPDISEQLARRREQPLLKGFRHILQAREPEFMLQPGFMQGIAGLLRYKFTYDILVYPRHLAAVKQFVAAFPDQPFIIDHLAKPLVKEGRIDDWAADIRALAAYPNLYCKVSGMLTEANWHQWQQSDFIPYLDVVSEAFGTHRLLFGSDWPVCLVAGSYGEVLSVIEQYYSAAELEKVMGANAVDFYHL